MGPTIQHILCDVDGMEPLLGFAEWAWARHHNVLSWYIRPLFLIPFCYFAYRRNLVAVIATLVALLTSMFWFPVPEHVPPGVLAALAAERAYLLSPWSIPKVAVALLVPGMLAALALAFWRRSLVWGAVVVNAIAIAKVSWTGVVFEAEGFLEHLAPAVAGLVVCNVALLAWHMRLRRNDHNQPQPEHRVRR
ncbi:MAG: hypothetical protein KF892_07430 [Rhizobacter sp.]|nr:hypothetical protein [Rhizobacter sp.]